MKNAGKMPALRNGDKHRVVEKKTPRPEAGRTFLWQKVYYPSISLVK
jgi:hypothetical protein